MKLTNAVHAVEAQEMDNGLRFMWQVIVEAQ